MPVSAFVPRILAHIDVERWGPRKAELLTLVAAFQGDGPNPVPLGRRTLLALGRSPRQAKYDHEEVLVALASDGVLMRWRGTGTRPDAWAVAELARWRHIPWTTPRREVLKLFSRPLPDAAVSLWPDRAGQRRSSGQIEPRNGASAGIGLSVDDLATPARPLATSAPVERGFGPPPGHNDTAPERPSPCFYESESGSKDPLPHSLRREGGRERSDPSDPGNQLLAAVAAAVGSNTALIGEVNDRIRAVGRLHAEHLADLLAFTKGLGWIRTGTGAAQAVEERARVLAAVAARTNPRQSIEAERTYLERMLAIEERDGGDPEVIERLRSQLTSLGGA